jgi:hypothetical protein
MTTATRIIHLVHELSGRLRLRLSWVRDAPAEATAVADLLAAVPGMIEVRVRPLTGSVLCLYDPQRLSADRILATLREAGGADLIVLPGEAEPAEEAELLRRARHEGNAIACAAAGLFRGLNLDVLRFTEGRLDLGTLVALVFVAAGAAQVASSRKLPAPPWFNLAWWAFRTFTTMEKPAIRKAASDMEAAACP